MAMKMALTAVKAVFPLSDTQLVVLLAKPVGDVKPSIRSFAASASDLRLRSVDVDERQPTRLVLTTSSMQSDRTIVDSLAVKALVLDGVRQPLNGVTPPFVLGVKNPSDLKVPHVGAAFPYATTLAGVHVTVACCTGCNGGIHDRNLVVINHHVGGPWTGIWVETGKTIDAPYPRWQKVMCAGGVVAERSGSTTVVDQGWMEIQKQAEVPHHAPPPLPIATADFPNTPRKELFLKGLDASWVQFENVRVERAVQVPADPRPSKTLSLPRNEITFTDRSGGRSTAYLYQRSGLRLGAGQELRLLRGFVHAEKAGLYVLLSDKEEDLVS